mmetsp:Transcript_22475/g.30074  ORF Transcript_22475/g.30074 Transcript_22475/m.30074 type:complete len:223 (+) Transcript_22475:2-670(+)
MQFFYSRSVTHFNLSADRHIRPDLCAWVDLSRRVDIYQALNLGRPDFPGSREQRRIVSPVKLHEELLGLEKFVDMVDPYPKVLPFVQVEKICFLLFTEGQQNIFHARPFPLGEDFIDHRISELIEELGEVVLLLRFVSLVTLLLDTANELVVMQQVGREEVDAAVDRQVATLTSLRVVDHLLRLAVLDEGPEAVVLVRVVLRRHDRQLRLLALLKLKHAADG